MAMRRYGMTKILYGMEYTEAPEARIEAQREALDALGGPDPTVEPIDGPDNSAEWRDQVGADRFNCDEGDQDACARIEESEASLAAAIEEEQSAE